ncbi:hypothetical protein CCACVL1_00832, partial [Corchorus capsularis]
VLLGLLSGEPKYPETVIPFRLTSSSTYVSSTSSPDSVKSRPETRLGNRKETSSSSGTGTLSLLTAPLDSEQLSSSDYGKT